jgi:hypothetical protein
MRFDFYDLNLTHGQLRFNRISFSKLAELVCLWRGEASFTDPGRALAPGKVRAVFQG